MIVIFSRKGFDSGIGKCASPILPSGEFWSIPIPDASSRTSYRDIVRGDQSLGGIVSDLTKGRFAPTRRAHLDPDLDARNIPRIDRWKPVFGQMGAAESHLRTQGVGPEDLFLFFGWFRRVEQSKFPEPITMLPARPICTCFLAGCRSSNASL